MNFKGKQKKNQVTMVNLFEQKELVAKAESIKSNLKASIWHEVETKGKFDKNEKLSFISDDMLILGCDIGSETHFVRAIDSRGRELSKSAFSFSNSLEGFQSAMEWAVKLAATHNKNQIVMGLEPTGKIQNLSQILLRMETSECHIFRKGSTQTLGDYQCFETSCVRTGFVTSIGYTEK